MKSCKVEDCDGKHYAKDYCRKHYLRFKKYGNPLEERQNLDVYCKYHFERFKKKIKVVQRDYETKCWEWQDGLSEDGYARFSVGSTRVRIHRFSYEYFKGKISEEMLVLHHCDNRKCCNPDHLFIGTQDDNIQDMINKGRKVTIKGEKVGTSKLTEKEVLYIRNYYKNNKQRGVIAHLARKFDVYHGTICQIVHGKIWKYLL